MTDEMESARRRAELADLADEYAEATGDERGRRAAGVLRGKRSGRHEIDDTAPLAFVAELVDAGLSRNSACIQAAIRYEPKELAIDAMKARLLTKIAGN